MIVNSTNIKYGITTFFIVALSMVSKTGNGQDVKFTASAPEAVENGTQFKIVYSVNAEASDFKLPKIEDFSFLAGPSPSQSSYMSTVNGKIESRFTLSYTLYYQAIKEGRFTIPPATIKVDKKEYKSNSLTIEVVKASSNLPQQQNQQPSQNQATSTSPSDAAFIRIFTDKKEAYVGEQIVATVKLFSKYQIDDNGAIKLPNYQGFFKQDIETQSSLQKENIDGQTYLTAILNREILFPQQTGNLTIESASIDLVLLERIESRFGFPNYKRFQHTATSNKVNIRVKPLPANKPADFNGAVGNFSLSGSVNKTNAKTNDALTFKVVLKGKGNINLINPPKLVMPQDFETYEPKSNISISNTIAGQSGTKTFEYLAVPRYAGNFTIPAITLSYFDPETGTFKRLRTQEFNISIEKGDDTINAQMVVGLSKEDVQLIGKDIRFIKTKAKLSLNNRSFFGSIYYYLTFPFLLLLLAIVIMIRRKHVKKRENTWLMKNKKANKVAIKRLHKANQHFKNNNHAEFYDEMAKALWGYVSDKLSLPIADLSKEYTRELFIKHHVGEDQANIFLQIIDDCEFARYSPSSEIVAMKEQYEKAIQTISKIEQQIR